MNLHVILVRGPCSSSLYGSNFSICAAEASTVTWLLMLLSHRNCYLSFSVIYLKKKKPLITKIIQAYLKTYMYREVYIVESQSFLKYSFIETTTFNMIYIYSTNSVC